MISLNIYIENEFPDWTPDIDNLKLLIEKIFNFYMSQPHVAKNSCLCGYEYKTVSFDFLFTNSKKTHQINKEYRNKDYPADIITFAVFADSAEDERFVLDFEINLGEIIIGLDKIIEESEKKQVEKDTELLFMISHGIMHLLGYDHQTENDFQFVVDNQKLALKSMGIDYDKI